MAKDFMMDSVYHQVREIVLQNQMNDGMKLNQNALAEQLHVSRTPVVKALNMLENDGLVDNIPQRGFYIHTPSIREVTELFTLRQALEMIAVGDLCRRGSKEIFDRLTDCFAPFSAEGPIDAAAYHEADVRFHQMIFDSCSNRLVERINDSLQIMARVLSFGLLRDPAETLQEHRALIAAMREGREADAKEGIRLHTEKSRKHLEQVRQQLETLGLDPDTISARDIRFRKEAEEETK